MTPDLNTDLIVNPEGLSGLSVHLTETLVVVITMILNTKTIGRRAQNTYYELFIPSRKKEVGITSKKYSHHQPYYAVLILDSLFSGSRLVLFLAYS